MAIKPEVRRKNEFQKSWSKISTTIGLGLPVRLQRSIRTNWKKVSLSGHFFGPWVHKNNFEFNAQDTFLAKTLKKNKILKAKARKKTQQF